MGEDGLARSMGRAAEVLADAKSVALACHLNPDPDAIGSMLGLGLFLAARGTTVVCSWGNQPLNLPRWLEVIGGPGPIVEANTFPQSPEVMVALDTASQDRLGILASNAERAGELVVFDHHRTNPGFGTVSVLDPAASSTGELVYEVAERIGGDLPDAAAAALYAAILADTGRFQYEAATPRTLTVAADLRSHDFDHVRLGQLLFEDGSLGYLRVLSVALERLAHVPEADLAWTYLTQSDLAAAEVPITETDDLIEVIRTAREADVACLLKQQRDGRFKVSLRSRGGHDVSAIAAAHGGGGHRLAAGYTAPSGVEETMRAVIEALTRQ